ncbi:hypothetical protein JAAARDRAFT_29852 [Jaapia argillacea MUCL 33604]|uniref:ER membrane protein complex subunit 7 beta-sandwich domain-containing protein n=1 Tax=Jaapia argillacea MUCL 33604 TaxID=933084 RepID=A0A067QCC1_9AGAM|nr:hypothetical protein JAAARDRAFT_29852 [Jaapia argillacea MUCL 33604]
MRLVALVLCIVSLCCAALALDVKGRIDWNDACPGVGELGAAKVILDDGRWSSGIRRDGSFKIPDVEPGTYILSVQAHDHTFDKLRIDVVSTSPLPEIHPYIPGTPLSPASPVVLPYPITLSAKGRHNYFVERQGFNLMGMFQNPMMLMMVVGGAMVFAVPYLTKNMDPEMLQEVAERQAKIQNIQSSLVSGDVKSSFNSLLTMDDKPQGNSSGVAASQKANHTPNKSKGGKGKRR